MLLLAMAGISAEAAHAAQAPAAVKQADLTIYHIEMRRSMRVIWLAEELEIPYNLVFKRGDIAGSMELIREMSPLMPMAPTVKYKGNVYVESGGILDLLLSEYGNGRLVPPNGSADLGNHYQWMHFAEGTAMYRAWAARYASMVANIPITDVPKGYQTGVKSSGLVGVPAVYAFVEDYLSRNPYFGGGHFSAADIMMHFAVKSAGPAAGIDISGYKNVAAWVERVEARPAFQRAIKVALPGGHDKDGNGCGLPIPFSNPPAVYACP